MERKIPALGHLKICLEMVSGLLAEIVQAAAQDVDALDKAKANKLEGVSFVIPATGWQTDETPDYPYYWEISVPGVTAKDRARVDLSPSMQMAAAVCGLCPATETLENTIRLRSAKIPAVEMAAEYRIEEGM